MRFSNIHVDGFGALSDQDIGPLHGGLNIVLGGNETGKSTLLDFVRGILYGFADRRSPKSYREPLAGGRHGGSISLRDDHGSVFTIERHVGKTVSITRDSGAPTSSSELSGILGHTDRKVFESIFAFGLDELAEAERLHDESVRDLIFSAGVAGAGRSASLALRRLEDERSEITKNSRSQGQANQLLQLMRERDECLEQLRLARTQSNSYLGLQREIDRLDRVAKSTFARLSERERRRQELNDLADADRARQRRLALERSLAHVPEPSPGEVRLASMRQQLEALAIRAESYQRDVAECDRLFRDLETQRATIEALRDRIGMRPGQGGLRNITLGVQSEIEALERRYQSTQLDIHTQTGILQKAEDSLERQRVVLARLTKDHQPGEFDEMPATLRELSTLRSMLSSGRELALEVQLAQRDRRPEARSLTGLDRMIAAVLGLVALLGLVAGGAHLTKPAHASVTVGLLGVVVSLVALAGIFLLARQSHQQRVDSSQEGDAAGSDALGSLDTRIAERSERLGLPRRPTDAELDELETQLRERDTIAGEIRTALVGEQQCVDELNVAREELARSERTRDELRTLSAQYCEELGIDRHVEPDALVKIVDSISSLIALEASYQSELVRLPELRDLIDAFEVDLRALCHEIQRPFPDRTGFARFLEEILKEADLARQQIAARDSIVAEIGTIDEVLGSLIDRGGEGERLRAELEHGSEAERELERETLSLELEQIKSEIELIVGQRHERQIELAALSSSSSIAELEIRLSTTEIGIREIFNRWAVLTLSGLFLKEALNRYEIERQPAVIERAGILFAQVTEGRYTKLVSHEDEQQRRSLRVIQDDGRSFDAAYLSKGTAEQLYLCVRLAYATTFAERSVAMPLIFDDVLVNFDPTRCQQMARAIAAVATQHQVILFTCHPNIAETLSGASAHANTIKLDRLA